MHLVKALSLLLALPAVLGLTPPTISTAPKIKFHRFSDDRCTIPVYHVEDLSLSRCKTFRHRTPFTSFAYSFHGKCEVNVFEERFCKGPMQVLPLTDGKEGLGDECVRVAFGEAGGHSGGSDGEVKKRGEGAGKVVGGRSVAVYCGDHVDHVDLPLWARMA